MAKPKLIHVGDAFVDPTDVAAIVNVKRDLYVVRLKSQPNAEHPLWVNGEEEIAKLLNHFVIVEED